MKKVSGSTTTVYIFSGSKVIAEYSGTSVPYPLTREYIYSGGALLAKFEAGATSYYHPDHLSNRVITDSSGIVAGTRGHYPYGENWYESGTTTKLKFTTYERDSESGNDFALARYHVNRLGRFSSPDPLGGSTANPQTLNRFSYVVNDPVDFADPLGLCTQVIGLTVTWFRDDEGVVHVVSFSVDYMYYLNCSVMTMLYQGARARRGGSDPKKDQQDAISRILSSGNCLTFLQNVIATLFSGTNRNSSTPPTNEVLMNQAQATQLPAVMNQMVAQISGLSFDWNEHRKNVVASVNNSTNVSLNPTLYPGQSATDRQITWMHESFHSTLATMGGFNDVSMGLVVGGVMPGGLSSEQAQAWGSQTFNDALKKNCGDQ